MPYSSHAADLSLAMLHLLTPGPHHGKHYLELLRGVRSAALPARDRAALCNEHTNKQQEWKARRFRKICLFEFISVSFF